MKRGKEFLDKEGAENVPKMHKLQKMSHFLSQTTFLCFYTRFLKFIKVHEEIGSSLNYFEVIKMQDNPFNIPFGKEPNTSISRNRCPDQNVIAFSFHTTDNIIKYLINHS